MRIRSPLLALAAVVVAMAGAGPAWATSTATVTDGVLKVTGTDGADHVNVTLAATSPQDLETSLYRVGDAVAVTAKDGCVQHSPTMALCPRGGVALGQFRVEARGGAGNDELSVHYPPGISGDSVTLYGEAGDDRLLGLTGWHESLVCGDGSGDVASRDAELDTVSADCENVGPITPDPYPVPCPAGSTATYCQCPTGYTSPDPACHPSCPVATSRAGLRYSCPYFEPDCSTLPADRRTNCQDPPCASGSYRPARGEPCRPDDCFRPGVICDPPVRPHISNHDGPPATATVSARGSFTLPQQIHCPLLPGPQDQPPAWCEVTTNVRARLTGKAKRAAKLWLGVREHSVRSGSKAPVRGRLSASGLRRLQLSRTMKVTVRVSLTWQGRSVTRDLPVRLRAPRRPAR